MNNKVDLVLCLPGDNFSGNFLDCLLNTINVLERKGLKIIISRKYSCNIYYVRNMCLGANVARGQKQKPFGGQLDYKYLMWIDSDMIFRPQQILDLMKHDKDIIGGLCKMNDNLQYATVEKWDENYFKKHLSFKFLTKDTLPSNTDPFMVSHTGFGFLMIKHGVFESMNYPWFAPKLLRIDNMVDYSTEDVAFCLRATDLNYKIWIDPTVIIGHEKKQILI